MEDTGSSSEASSSTAAEENKCDTTSWTSWKLLRGLLKDRMSRSERLDVLKALGRCKSIRSVDTRDLEYCQLSVLEWDILLRTLKSNPTLEEITIKLDFGEPGHVWCNPSDNWIQVLESVPVLKKLEIMDYSNPHLPHDLLSLFLAPRARGLQRNLNPSVEELRIAFGRNYKRSALTLVQVADMVRSSLRLRKLELTHIHYYASYLEETEVRSLSNALKQSSSLRVLEINGAWEEGMAKVLFQAITGVDSNLSLKKLLLKGSRMEGLGLYLPHLLKANISHVALVSSDDYFGTYTWRQIGYALLQPAGLQTFTVHVGCVGVATRLPTSKKWAEELLEASQQSPRLSFSLVIDFPSFKEDMVIALLGLVRMRHVHLLSCDITNKGLSFLEKVMDTLNSNQDVVTCYLEVPKFDMVQEGWRRRMFDKVGDNTSVKVLTLRPLPGVTNQEIFELVMKLLHRNFALQEIHVESSEWVSEGKPALVQEALNRNARLANFMSVVRKAGQFSAIKAGRILLCGSPYAGKTRLTTTMLKVAKTWRIYWWSTKLLRSISYFQYSKLSRTKGIEISTLRDDGRMNVAVWDLGGQWIFRALQDLLFPKAGQACIYLFVFNPFEIVNGEYCIKADLSSAFRKELKSWLRFIASNSPIITNLPPQMMVVISHKDVMQQQKRDLDLEWARSNTLQLQPTFKGKVDLSLDTGDSLSLTKALKEVPNQNKGPHKDLHFVDCFDSEDVWDVLHSIFQRMESLLETLMAKNFVPSPGIELTSLFARKPSKVRDCPIWTSSDLSTFCRENIGPACLQDLNPVETQTVLEALVIYLHEVGSIIMVPDSDLVVVDPNWMTEKFLGELINYGHGFSAEKPRIPQTYRNCSSHDGFIDSHNFNCILTSLVESYKEEDIQVERDHLKELFVKLDLCIELDDRDGNRRYFMPAICGGKEEKLPVQSCSGR